MSMHGREAASFFPVYEPALLHKVLLGGIEPRIDQDLLVRQELRSDTIGTLQLFFLVNGHREQLISEVVYNGFTTIGL